MISITSHLPHLALVIFAATGMYRTCTDSAEEIEHTHFQMPLNKSILSQKFSSPKKSDVKVISILPHDREAFTEGLAFLNGHLYESTGIYGHSALREIDVDSGKELRRISLGEQYFGEGLTALGGKLFQLTWREHICFVYDPITFRKINELRYEEEGWGLTNDGKLLIMSDGSEWLRYRDPSTMEVKRVLQVTYKGRPVNNLNELEFINGIIWANVWKSNLILRIAPSDGHVVEILDAVKVVPTLSQSNVRKNVLNGIAFDKKKKTILITGKRWPLMFRIQ